MAKIALVTDTHWGVRNDDQNFAKYQIKFYREVFFPYVDDNKIKHLIHLGDIFDRRKYVNYLTASNFRLEFAHQCHIRDIESYLLMGNHDVFYKNTNKINSIGELYTNSEYMKNSTSYWKTKEIEIEGCKILLVPWICEENKEDTLELLRLTKSEIVFGHLELNGFKMYKDSIECKSDFNADLFSKFDMVFSGHFHHKSSQGNIHYLGAPYEMTWNDYDDDRGFHVFDTETRELTFIKNPYKMFHKIFYDETDQKTKILPDIAGTYVKLIVEKKTNPMKFDQYVEALEKIGPLDLQVVEAHSHQDQLSEETLVDLSESTPSILRSQIRELKDVSVDLDKLENLMLKLYSEAVTVE